jgi:hypothetical protein
MSGNPLDPTLAEAMSEALSEEERAEFETYVRGLVDSGAEINRRGATAYLRAVKRTASATKP